MVGKTLGHYEILEPLGAGGMGEVYRARDTKLDRDVAIKALPEDFARDAERLARFEREAKLLASLNHANIAAIYGLEVEGETRFIAMELVEGETLADRITKSGRIEVEEALDIARQIAEALEAAHENGVIHRDLKPANVIVTRDGKAKVLDFGLAKVSASEGGDTSEALTHSPTATVGATEAGVLLGTAPYMSPEQAKGKVLDKRTDIWAFGCVLYEMLTGKRPFDAENVTEMLAAVLKEEPDWELLPADTPRILALLLRRCLRKDPRRRLRDIGDAWIEIEEAALAADMPTGELVHAAAADARRTGWRTVALVLVSVALLVASAALWTSLQAPRARAGDRIRAQILLPEGWRAAHRSTPVAFSPDGTTLVMNMYRPGDMVGALWTRPLGENDWQRLQGTTDLDWPFYSTTGEWIGFVRNGELRRIPAIGGRSSSIAVPSQGRFGASSWGADDIIVTTNGGSLYTVPADGEREAEILAAPDAERGEIAYDLPRHISGTDAVLFTIQREDRAPGSLRPSVRFEVAVLELDDPDSRRALVPGRDGRYLDSGHLLCVDDNGRFSVVPFDADRLRVTGPEGAAPLVDRVRRFDNHALWAVSTNGTLAWFEPAPLTPQEYRPVWYELGGGSTELPPLQRLGELGGVRLLDDTRLAYRIRFPGADGSPVSADRLRYLGTTNNEEQLDEPIGIRSREWIYYDSSGDIHRRPVAAGGDSEPVLEQIGVQSVTAVSPDGDFIVYRHTLRPAAGENRQMIYSVTEKGDPYPVDDREGNQLHSAISADGKRIAWSSTFEGTSKIFVASFPIPGEPTNVSQGHGTNPVFPRDNPSRLFFQRGREIFVVDLDADGNWSSPRRVFAGFWPGANDGPWDASSDGRRLLVVESMDETVAVDPQTRLQVFPNWSEELKRLAPAGGSQ